MDLEAVLAAESDVLKRNGLKTYGDIIKLKVFCRTNGTSDRKKELKRSLSIKDRTVKDKEHDVKTKTLYFSWENFDKRKNKWCIVKGDKGGGTKYAKFPLNTTKSEILDFCKAQYWDKRDK